MSAERPNEAIEEEAQEEEFQPESAEKSQPESAGEVDLAAALAEAEAKAEGNWQKYLRAVAEAENVRKRSARDVENAHRFALERFGKELLAVTDGLEMALGVSDNATVESLLEGSRATLKLLSSTMERFGISVVDPEGEPFNPELHEAVSMQPSDTVEPGSVVTVLQKGYVLNDRLLRPATVIVAE